MLNSGRSTPSQSAQGGQYNALSLTALALLPAVTVLTLTWLRTVPVTAASLRHQKCCHSVESLLHKCWGLTFSNFGRAPSHPQSTAWIIYWGSPAVCWPQKWLCIPVSFCTRKKILLKTLLSEQCLTKADTAKKAMKGDKLLASREKGPK